MRKIFCFLSVILQFITVAYSQSTHPVITMAATPEVG